MEAGEEAAAAGPAAASKAAVAVAGDSADADAGAGADDADGGGACELVTFSSVGDAYVYAPLPPAPAYGHRAELWGLDKWIKEVRVAVVVAGDGAAVRLRVSDGGELFAEAPLPRDAATPLTAAVDPVVDSSRYFVMRVADGKRHAFVGVGFRERDDASQFAAALDDYRRQVARREEAARLAARFGAALVAAGGGEGGGGEGGSGEGAAAGGGETAAAGAGAAGDLGLKPGETLTLSKTLAQSFKRAGSAKAALGRSGSGGSGSATLVAVPALGSTGVLLPPPPAVAPVRQRQQQQQQQPAAPGAAAPADAGGGGGGGDNDDGDDEWGDFTG